MRVVPLVVAAVVLASCGPKVGPADAKSIAAEPSQVYWGDTHLHTSYSPDAFFFGNTTADPDTAYRYAKGLPVVHPYHKARVQIETPLDFLVVADHAEMMGVPFRLSQDDKSIAGTENGKRLIKMMTQGKGQAVFLEFIERINTGRPYADLDSASIKRSVWEDMVAITERHNEMCVFTTFIGWEWTSTPNGKNLHRVVFMPEGGDVAKKFIPFNSFDSSKPEDLWAWLGKTSKETGANFIAIPHNSNISGGLMFNDVDSEGRPITAEYARTRMTWEPVVEITQIKGDSETHSILSTTDEFADFEVFSHAIDAKTLGKEGGHAAAVDPGDYVRSGLKRGLEIEATTGVNPYKFGFVGSTDSHTGLSSAEENNFHGKTAYDSIPKNRFNEFLGIKGFGADMSAAGMAGVWAEENSREALFTAFKRKEVYATTGPRIRVRFFGGWAYEAKDAAAKNLVKRGYTKGFPMGSDITKGPQGRAPSFLMYAVKDPKGGNLDRIQVVKGWLDPEGKSHEKVFDVALSDGRKAGDDGKIPPVGNTVDVSTGFYTNDIGDPSLAVVWNDPEFDPTLRAFYYARVLQIPTPRHTLYDAIALGMDPKDTLHPATIQERAYSSPIWYAP